MSNNCHHGNLNQGARQQPDVLLADFDRPFQIRRTISEPHGCEVGSCAHLPAEHMR